LNSEPENAEFSKRYSLILQTPKENAEEIQAFVIQENGFVEQEVERPSTTMDSEDEFIQKVESVSQMFGHSPKI